MGLNSMRGDISFCRDETNAFGEVQHYFGDQQALTPVTESIAEGIDPLTTDPYEYPTDPELAATIRERDEQLQKKLTEYRSEIEAEVNKWKGIGA